MDQDTFTEGIHLLQHPVMPLVAMVQFLFMTGPFAKVTEVIDELPEPIETDRAVYEHPRELLTGYLDILSRYEDMKNGNFEEMIIVDEENNPFDPPTANTVIIQQQVLTKELERINSALCGPCGCTLCCVGPDEHMEQEFFEIPLSPDELDLFTVKRYESDESRTRNAYDDDELVCDGHPFYQRSNPGLFHWKNGWSLILPKVSRCPHLKANDQCDVYGERPEVCRRPQIFPYMVEPVDNDPENNPCYRIRQSLLAIVDCPYVRQLKDEIAGYAAASELHLVLKENKA